MRHVRSQGLQIAIRHVCGMLFTGDIIPMENVFFPSDIIAMGIDANYVSMSDTITKAKETRRHTP